jgi:small-conductance mechanosensitive channel
LARARKVLREVSVIAVLVLGALAVELIARGLRGMTSRAFDVRRGGEVAVAFRFLAYVALAFVVLALVGVPGTTVLSNVLGGVLLLIAHPYEIGDRVTVTTWQYGMVVPAYPGKFFSDDRLVVGRTGVVQGLRLTYTSLSLDAGPLMKTPNNVMVKAAVLTHSTPRWVQTRFEAPGHPDPEQLIETVEVAVRKNPWIVDPYRVPVTVQAITPTSAILALDTLCKSAFEDAPRSSILIDVSRAISAFTSAGS